MSIETILVSAAVGLVTGLVTAYYTVVFKMRQEREAWEREFAVKIVDARAKGRDISDYLVQQYAIAFLVVRTGTEVKRKVFIPPSGSILIGRNPELCDLVLHDDSYISTRHAIFRSRDSKVFVLDLGSSAGTIVNNERISPKEAVKLKPGDVIQIGRTEMTFYQIE
jgi:pSer/pThr/pTyr-binding forkhead associated (FHA) protein